jgi:hypothetical protein
MLADPISPSTPQGVDVSDIDAYLTFESETEGLTRIGSARRVSRDFDVEQRH